MSLLDGGIAATFAKAFAGIYLPATLHRMTLTEDGEGGWSGGAPEAFACRAQVDQASEAMRAAGLYADTDRRILVLKNTLGVEPSTDDQISVRGQRFGIASITTDPANSYWEMRGVRV